MKAIRWLGVAAGVTVLGMAATAAEPVVERIMLPPRLVDGNAGVVPVQEIDSASWIWHPEFAGLPEAGRRDLPDASAKRFADRAMYFDGGWRGPVFVRFRRDFEARSEPLVLHVSADERYELLLDGRRIARGPDRSPVDAWSYATYKVTLAPGPHRVEALCWSLGPLSPMAQLTWRGGFILKAEGGYDKALTTGRAPWQAARLDGLTLAPPREPSIFAVGGELTAAGCGPQWKEGAFGPVAVVRGPVPNQPYGQYVAGWRLHPSTLPAMIDRRIRTGRAAALTAAADPAAPVGTEAGAHPDLPKWQALIDGRGEVVVPPNTTVSMLWHLGAYQCAHPFAEVSGGSGATVEWGWAESLYLPGGRAKGHRGEFAGKVFKGMVDTFLPDGGARRPFSTHWWRAGLWCRVRVTTAAAPLTIHALALDETRYPLEFEGAVDAGDPGLPGVVGLAVRGMQMCSHETFMDCPYYEQLMYVGDSRLEMLTTHVMTRDDRLVRRGIELFDRSRSNGGFVNERFPAHVPQMSTTFSMIWALMVRDYAWWRNDRAWVKARAPGLRAMLDNFDAFLNSDGLLDGLPGWSFMDWVPEWKVGYAPDGRDGCSALNNLLYVHALQAAADVEESLAEPALAARLRGKAGRVQEAIRARFWDPGRGLVADNLAHTAFSEHGQCLALLTGTLADGDARRAFENLLTAPDLSRTTIYFSFYLLETWQKFGRGDLIVDRLAFWKDLVKQGLSTPVEAPGDTRSDCHAWGSHPLFHLYASLAGIRPASPGFRTVRIAPQPGRLPAIRARLPHPDGFIAVDLAFTGDACTGTIDLPPGITGTFAWKGRETALKPGPQTVEYR